MQTTKNNWSRLSWLEFNDWFKKVKAYEKMKVTSAKADETLQQIKQMHRPLDVAISSQSLLALFTVWNGTLCGVALCFVAKQQGRDRKLLLIKNFVFCASMGSTSSGSARNHVSARQKVVQSLATSRYSQPSVFSRLNLHVD